MYFTPRFLTGIALFAFVASSLFAGGPETSSSKASSQSSTPAASSASPATNINVTVDALSNRHPISPYVYGGAYPQDAPTISDSGMTVVRWGGNATSRYNWLAGTENSAADWYYGDYGYTEIGESDSSKFIEDVKAAGSNPLMTMV